MREPWKPVPPLAKLGVYLGTAGVDVKGRRGVARGESEIMGAKQLDVVAIGNAIVDVIARADDAFLSAQGIDKGVMTLIDEARATTLYAAMGPAIESSGGSAANTIAGLANLGAATAISEWSPRTIWARSFATISPPLVSTFRPPVAGGPATARCLIVVTPDAQRSMNTFLGACADLSVAHLDSALLAAAKVVYLEGYLWDRPSAKAAFLEACRQTHAAGGKIALTLSDPFCVDRHRESFRSLIADEVDILFANVDELTALHETDDLEAALAATAKWVEVAAVTRGPEGAVILAGDTRAEIAAQPVPEVIDTTGAGDLFAAGFLRAYTQNLDLATCGRYGAIAAAEVISRFGARPESDLAELVAAAPAAWQRRRPSRCCASPRRCSARSCCLFGRRSRSRSLA